MARELPPPHWVRVQALVDASGWPAVLAMTGMPRNPVECAEDEAPRLRDIYGVTVLRDGTGRPCVDPAAPGVLDWQAELDDRVSRTSAALERELERSRGPMVVDIEHETLEVPGG